MSQASVSAEWKKTACVLCGQNCGVEVQTDNGHFTKIRGDKAHPGSQGYQCQKASQLEHYQNHDHRLTKPLRRRADGTFEEVSWETAIAEVAAKLSSIRDEHGGHTIAYFGGGGQGNHLGGTYGSALRAACETNFLYTSLAQEKTGGFWLNGRIFGKQSNIPISDHHHSDFILAIGWNPWQSHGIPRARKVLQDLSKDPTKTLVVIDPRRTETAAKADHHIQVAPGGDAHLMLAMLAYIVQEDLEDREFIDRHCEGFNELRQTLAEIPVDDYCTEAGVDPAQIKEVTRKMAQAKAVAVHTDLGLEHSLHSTLNLYLSKLLWLVTGNFGKTGTQAFAPTFVPLVGNSKDPEQGGRSTRVTGAREIGKLYPPNNLASEIDNDNKDRLRALFVDSGNPAMTVADGQATRKAFEKLDLLVVVDIAMTETASMADYVLPASTQYEKWECTFFSPGFPQKVFHLREPIFEPQGDTLPEPEIYRRLVVAMGALPDSFPELEEAAREHRKDPSKKIFPMALAQAFEQHPEWSKYSPIVLYATLGKALPNGAASAALLWFVAQRFADRYPNAALEAGIRDEGAGLGEALFEKILEEKSGLIFSETKIEESWEFVSHADAKIHLVVPEMIQEIHELEPLAADAEYPFILSAGERRAYNANQIMRTPKWRKKDEEGALKVHPADAATIGLEEGGLAHVRSKKGSIEATVQITDEVREGFVTLPHGYTTVSRTESGDVFVGPDVNQLSTEEHCDAIARTPFHKYIPVAVVPALVPAK